VKVENAGRTACVFWGEDGAPQDHPLRVAGGKLFSPDCYLGGPQDELARTQLRVVVVVPAGPEDELG
jgi:hypothetical protein